MNYNAWKEYHRSDLSNLKSYISILHKSSDFPLYHLLGDEGNRKLPATTAIFNMASAKNCPSMKLGLCKATKQGAKCYACKAEDLYPLVLPYRERQAKLWSGISAEEFASQFLMINAFKVRPFNALRFNESGDFHDQRCVDKAEKIARILKKHGIVTYCYTSRDDLSYAEVRDLVIHGSGFTKKGIKGIFKIIEKKEDKVKGWGLCRMNCRVCTMCQKFSNVCIVKH